MKGKICQSLADRDDCSVLLYELFLVYTYGCNVDIEGLIMSVFMTKIVFVFYLIFLLQIIN